MHRGKKAIKCLTNIYGNDTLGDCTAAGAGHGLGIWRANAGNNDPAPTTDEVIAFYSATTGYVPGNPSTDQGGDEVTVLNYWRTNGFVVGGRQAASMHGATSTRPTRKRFAKQFGWRSSSTSAWSCPMRGYPPMPQQSGFTWDVAGDAVPANGHCFIAGSYDGPDKVIIDTWGEFGYITDAAIAKYASGAGGELHACFSRDSINRATQKTDSGFDFATLLADSAAFQ